MGMLYVRPWSPARSTKSFAERLDNDAAIDKYRGLCVDGSGGVEGVEGVGGVEERRGRRGERKKWNSFFFEFFFGKKNVPRAFFFEKIDRLCSNSVFLLIFEQQKCNKNAQYFFFFLTCKKRGGSTMWYGEGKEKLHFRYPRQKEKKWG